MRVRTKGRRHCISTQSFAWCSRTRTCARARRHPTPSMRSHEHTSTHARSLARASGRHTQPPTTPGMTANSLPQPHCTARSARTTRTPSMWPCTSRRRRRPAPIPATQRTPPIFPHHCHNTSSHSHSLPRGRQGYRHAAGAHLDGLVRGARRQPFAVVVKRDVVNVVIVHGTKVRGPGRLHQHTHTRPWGRQGSKPRTTGSTNAARGELITVTGKTHQAHLLHIPSPTHPHRTRSAHEGGAPSPEPRCVCGNRAGHHFRSRGTLLCGVGARGI